MRFLFLIVYGLIVPFLCFGDGVSVSTPFYIKKPYIIPFFSKTIPSNDVLTDRANCILKKGNIGLTRDQLITAFQYIERGTLDKKIKLPCHIEKSKNFNRFVIREIQSKEAHIGRGFHKVVKKAIMYGPRPKIIADCISDDSARQEIVFLKKLRGVEGIVKFYGSVKRGKKYSIYLEYFQQGSLLHRFNEGKSIEPYTLKIAYDVAKGLQGMHQNKLVHRDLHAGNVLLEISDTSCKAVLVDFGKTLFAYRTLPSSPQVPRTANPPEGLIKSFCKIDRYKADVYGLGCLFYRMAIGEHNPWSNVFNIYRLGTYNKATRRKYYEKMISSYQETKKKTLSGILKRQKEGKTITSREKFLILIFSMLDSKPQRRPTIEQVVSSLGELL